MEHYTEEMLSGIYEYLLCCLTMTESILECRYFILLAVYITMLIPNADNTK